MSRQKREQNPRKMPPTRGNPERRRREWRRTEERKNTEMQKHKQSQAVHYGAMQCNEEEESWRWKNHTFDVEVREEGKREGKSSSCRERARRR